MKVELVLATPVFESPEDNQDCIVIDEFNTWLILTYDKSNKIFFNRYSRDDITIPESNVKYWAEIPNIKPAHD